ncbi:MAG: iron-containing alcohol dehydrogenase [Prevotella sp.]|nr:iron-containing alcohol dehydrogenase [Prevotella sp.]
MRDFNYFAPTQVVFGRESEEQVAALVKQYGGTKVLVHYGGKSAVKSGLLDKICGLLREGGIGFVTLGGVVPNPRLSLVHEGIKLCRQEGVDFLLAVGGGSVIDSCKAIAMGVANPDEEVWNYYTGKARLTRALPLASVLTIPAAGSEMSPATVITNEDGDMKIGYGNDLLRPKFAIMNPERTFTLPPYQTAAGVTDMMLHIFERYFTVDDDMDLTTALAEATLRTIKNAVFAVLKHPEDYRQRAQIMWGGSVAHWGLLGMGVQEDWATHQLEHELSAMFDVTHGAGLAAVWPSWARYTMHRNLRRFVRFAVNVMDVPNDYTDPEGTALRGIEAVERFYRAIGMPTNIKELIGRDITDDEIKEMVRKCSRDDTRHPGGLMVLYPKDMEAIYNLARG